MGKFIRDIQMGDYAISLKETQKGFFEAKLTSAEYGGLLEIEKLEDKKIRVRELDIGSSTISIEQLAFMLVLTEIDTELVKEIERIKKARKNL